jgi:hypothetical protein
MRIAKRRRITKLGLAADLATKEKARAACAAVNAPITKCPPGKPLKTKRGHKHPGRTLSLLG